jgi:hypothetical protein
MLAFLSGWHRTIEGKNARRGGNVLPFGRRDCTTVKPVARRHHLPGVADDPVSAPNM